jgi:hypothetical protein
VRYYPFVLGAQPVRMIELAAFCAAVANEGARPQPHAIDSIEVDCRTIYQPNTPPPTIGAAADHASFYQLKTILQGVVARGTARAIGGLALEASMPWFIEDRQTTNLLSTCCVQNNGRAARDPQSDLRQIGTGGSPRGVDEGLLSPSPNAAKTLRRAWADWMKPSANICGGRRSSVF